MDTARVDRETGAFLRGRDLLLALAEGVQDGVEEARAALRDGQKQAVEEALSDVERALAALPQAAQAFRSALDACFEPPADADAACAYCGGQGSLQNLAGRVPAILTCPYCGGAGDASGVFRQVAYLLGELECADVVVELLRLRVYASRCRGAGWRSLRTELDAVLAALDEDPRTPGGPEDADRLAQAARYVENARRYYGLDGGGPEQTATEEGAVP